MYLQRWMTRTSLQPRESESQSLYCSLHSQTMQTLSETKTIIVIIVRTEREREKERDTHTHIANSHANLSPCSDRNLSLSVCVCVCLFHHAVMTTRKPFSVQWPFPSLHGGVPQSPITRRPARRPIPGPSDTSHRPGVCGPHVFRLFSQSPVPSLCPPIRPAAPLGGCTVHRFLVYARARQHSVCRMLSGAAVRPLPLGPQQASRRSLPLLPAWATAPSRLPTGVPAGPADARLPLARTHPSEAAVSPSASVLGLGAQHALAAGTSLPRSRRPLAGGSRHARLPLCRSMIRTAPQASRSGSANCTGWRWVWTYIYIYISISIYIYIYLSISTPVSIPASLSREQD